ncbi:MAG: S-layer homology domain-containing protein, partial [Syntrophomonadaceae bacterium]|nr:S-layer homology domain-containing protein [Syntrophomonadaceae bacterium]
RAEFVTILVKVLALEPQDGQIFADTAGHWARDALATAEYYGIVKGYDENTFGPDDFVTREQMAAIVINATDLERVNEETSFKDSHLVSEWAREAVATAVKHGIINGFPDNTLRPLSNATRAEAVTVIVKVLNLLA